MYTDYLTTVNFNVLANKQNKYIVLHYTANNGDTAMNNAKYFHSENRGSSAHYFVDEGEVVRVVSDFDVAWHCGTTGTYKHAECRNSNSIGIEMCSRIDENGNYYIKNEVVKRSQNLVKYLMDLHNIPIDNVVRHYDVTGKSCPAPYVDEMKWAGFKEGLKVVDTVDNSLLTNITGKSKATISQMKKFLMSKNPKALNDFGELSEIYFNEGLIENIRGDVAFAQSCLETGFFTFGGDVLPQQNNFCGLGATGGGEMGESFLTVQEGVKAQIQHLKAYANDEELNGECIDPRFKYVQRGIAPYVEYLGIQENPSGKGWATDLGYGSKINVILNDILATLEAVEEPTQQPSDYAIDSWNKAIDKNITDGSNPLNTATRQDVMCFLDRLGLLG